ncbi:MAG: hypothetical protein JNJ46_17430 [Myxococcales bacterium]|nr:hypothetical protein [Myxococcales bacterium]
MLSSVWDRLRAWPAVPGGMLSLLLPAGEGATARVFDGKVASGLRALGYVVRRAKAEDAEAEPDAAIGLIAAILSLPRPLQADAETLARIRKDADTLPPGGWLLLRAPRSERERVAAAFVHAGLSQVSQIVSRRSVLTAGKRRP